MRTDSVSFIMVISTGVRRTITLKQRRSQLHLPPAVAASSTYSSTAGGSADAGAGLCIAEYVDSLTARGSSKGQQRVRACVLESSSNELVQICMHAACPAQLDFPSSSARKPCAEDVCRVKGVCAVN